LRYPRCNPLEPHGPADTMHAARRTESFDLERCNHHANPVGSQPTAPSTTLPRHSMTRWENNAKIRMAMLRTVDVHYRESLGIAQELEGQ
jgi:hypothetical protein